MLFRSIHCLLKRCIYSIQHISKTHLLVLLPRDFPAGILRWKIAIAVSMLVLVCRPKLMLMTSAVVDAHPSTNGTQCTVEEQLETHKPHTVSGLIKKRFSNVIIVVTLSNVEWMRRDSCQTILH